MWTLHASCTSIGGHDNKIYSNDTLQDKQMKQSSLVRTKINEIENVLSVNCYGNAIISFDLT